MGNGAPIEWNAERIAELVRQALESADLESYGDLLSPDVTWGAPGDSKPPCQNRQQVLKWYGNGRAAGARAQVMELTVAGEQLLVGLAVDFEGNGQASERWQVMTIASSGICDIRGYESRGEASAALDVAPV